MTQDAAALVEALRSMPALMRERSQWLLWRLEPNPGKPKLRKVPYYANGRIRHDKQGSASDRSALVTFEQALVALAAGDWAGLGFAFLPEDGLIGIDIDGAIDPATGEVSARCQAIVEACASYTEYSPSGTGVHIIVQGKTKTFKDNRIGVEVFCERQFFTCTGRRWTGTPSEVAPISEVALRRLKLTVQEARKAALGVTPTPAASGGVAAPSGSLTMWLEQALQVLDSAGCSYDEWIGIGMALRSALGDAGMALWDYWSRKGGERYCGAAKIEAHWKSFAGTDPDGAMVVFRMARRGNRWRPPKAWHDVYGNARGKGAAESAAQPPAEEAFAADLGPVREPVERATNVVQLPARSHEGLREPVGDAAETHHDLSKAWCEGRTVGGHSPVFTAGAFYVPCGDGMWRRLSAEAVQVDLAGMFNRKKLCRKNSDYRQIADHTTALCEREEFFDDAPAGIVTPAGFHALGAGGSIETVPVQLSHRQAFALAYRPEYEAESPLLDGVLRAAFDGADMADQIDLWWQCVGASLFAMMPKLQLVLLLLGRERSGKSLLQRLLERAFPAAAVGAVSPASWGHEYHVASLAGKRLNVVGELSDDAPIPAAAFKNVTGQNLVAGRHPTHRPFSFRCMAAHVFASNVLPPTTDRTDAFYRRWRVLRFANSVAPESVDPDLLDKIVAAEMRAFLAQAFLGAERVARAGRVRTTAQHDAALAKWRLAANPLEQFLDDTDWVTLEKEPDKVDLELWPKPATVYEHYRRWAATAGFRNPFGRNHFLDLLESTGAARRVRIRRAQSHNVVAGLWLTTRV